MFQADGVPKLVRKRGWIQISLAFNTQRPDDKAEAIPGIKCNSSRSVGHRSHDAQVENMLARVLDCFDKRQVHVAIEDRSAHFVS